MNRGRGGYDRGHSGYGFVGRNQHFRRNVSTYDQVNSNSRQGSGPFDSRQGFWPYVNNSQRYSDTNTYLPPKLSNNASLQDVKGVASPCLECQICRKLGHEALRCWYHNSYQMEVVPIALAAMHLEDPKGDEWFLDTGATAHMSSNHGIL